MRGGAASPVQAADLSKMSNNQGIITPDVKITNVQGLSNDCKDRLRYVAKRYESPVTGMKYTGITPEPSADHASRPAPWRAAGSSLTAFPDPFSKKENFLTFYIDPKDMTPAQVQKFKFQAKFEKMTVQDYTNWLLLFQNTPEQLTAFHRANLRIVVRGGKLTQADMPVVKALPASAEQEYLKKMTQGSLDNLPQPEYLGFQPYNMDQQAAPFISVNRNLRHMDFVNPDEPLKTWELTQESKKIKKPL
jgi:hypothetical protein